MSQSVDPSRRRCLCPACGQAYAVAPADLGKKARCAKCGVTFPLAEAPADDARRGSTRAAPSSSAAQSASAGGLCPICQVPIQPGESTTQCPDCKTLYHAECWTENKGCGVYGCPQVPPTEHLGTLEIPVSYWGQEEKKCPMCTRTIQAAAVRCRFCGATFASARPENADEFLSRAGVEQSLPGIRKTGVWLLILGVIPCTAPLVAVIGPIWYARHRKEVARLPALHAALCKIGVGVGVGQTALAILLLILYGLFGKGGA